MGEQRLEYPRVQISHNTDGETDVWVILDDTQGIHLVCGYKGEGEYLEVYVTGGRLNPKDTALVYNLVTCSNNSKNGQT